MRSFWVILSFILLGSAPAFAASAVGTPHVQIHLIADKTAVAPGDTVTIAISQDILAGWHVYWRNPGDSGIAPSTDWILPKDYAAGPLQWPPPSRLAFGPLVNFGYAGHVVLLTDIKVPADAMVGNPAKFTTTLSWLVCQETCIPETAVLDIAVPVETESVTDPATTDLFFRTRASIPAAATFPAELSSDPKVLTLTIHTAPPAEAFFYPFKAGLIDDSSPQLIEPHDDDFTLQLVRGELRQPLTSVDGVLETFDASGRMVAAYTLIAAMPDTPRPAPIVTPAHTGLLAALGLALLGGIILNLMPCVFPVLSLKVLALARHAEGGRSETRLSGIAYTVGVLLAFLAIAIVLLCLRAAGSAIGWGFQLQSPPFVLCLAYLLFAMGLSLSGFFTLQGKFVNLGAGLATREGAMGSFFTGALAALVATPCSAPFMGTAIGFALTQAWPIALAIIEFLGLGLALPYLILAFNPRWVGFMPRPGAWMERLKQLLAFPLYGSAVWLVWVLSLQTGPHGILIAMGGALLLSFAVWCFNISHHVHHAGWRRVFIVLCGFSLLSVIAGAMSPTLWHAQETQSIADSFIPPGWENFTPERLQELQHAGTPVFVDMSAAWCITCIVNEKMALGPDMTKALAAKGVVLLKGDWTNQDKQITALLASFGRSGVPLYVYYPPHNQTPVVLPQILSRGIVLKAVSP
jgi:thiol:disulfide interchange protein DsbD